MDIVLAAIGSYGDVYPLISIGAALKARGHRVTLISAAPFADTAEKAGLAFIECLSQAEYARYVEVDSLRNTMDEIRFLAALTMAPMRTVYDILCKHFDPKQTLLIASPLVLGARIAQEKHQFHLISIVLQPASFYSTEKPIEVQVIPKCIQNNRFLRVLMLFFFLKFFDHVLEPLQVFRRELGLPKKNNLVREWGFSPEKIIALFPQWLTTVPSDLPKQIFFTGFIRAAVTRAHELPIKLIHFLEAGEPPIVFTCGTSVRGEANFFKMATAVVTALKKRAIFVTLYPEQLPSQLPENILCVDYAPFDLLFPRAGLLVHHGGIGTTAQGLASGVPQLIVPKILDQFNNAACIEALGCGASLSLKEREAKNLKEKIMYLWHADTVRARCREVAATINFEEALKQTCDLIEQA